MTLEEKAKKLASSVPLRKDIPFQDYIRIQLASMYYTGAVENGIVWHDLRKNTEYLPTENKRYLCKIKCFIGGDISYECFDYDTEYDSWKDTCSEVIAWCEIPQYTEE